MQTVAAQLDHAFRSAISKAFDGLEADALVGPAQNEKFGDYQANAAMGLAKLIAQKTGQKTNPREVATQIVQNLDLGDIIDSPDAISIAGPGFINIKLSSRWLANRLQAMAADTRLGIDTASAPRRVVIDYSGPNIAKQMHIGHLRPTNIGDALSRILEFQGHDLIRQNHLGDWGTQFGMLISRLKEQGAAGDQQIADLEAFYRQAKKRFDEDPAFADTARQTVVRLQAGGTEELDLWRKFVDESRRHFQPLYQRMNIRLTQADERGESFYNPMLPGVVQELRDKSVAVESQGAIVVWVQGFETPLIIQKSDGGFGYATTDLAAIRFRTTDLHATQLIYVTDVRQTQHFKQVFDTATRAGWVTAPALSHVTFGTILGPDGKPLKTKSGENVKLADVLDEAEQRALNLVTAKNPELPADQQRAIAHAVGIGAIKYYDLVRDRGTDYLFDWDQMLAMDGNTAPYLQYAYARICSVFRKATAAGLSAFAGPDAPSVLASRINLTTPQELALAKCLLRLADVLETVTRELKAHHLCSYLYDLSAKLSSFYEACPVLDSEPSLRASRLGLIGLSARTIALGLDLLGIEHPVQM